VRGRALGAGIVLALALVLSTRITNALSIDVVARECASALAGLPLSTIVVAAPLQADQSAPREDELAVRIGALLAGHLGGGARAHPQTARLSVARALAGHAGALAYVQAAIAGGELRAAVDVYPPAANVWDRIRNPVPPPTVHAFASAPIDAEVRSYLTPLLLEQSRVERARHSEGEILAAGCGDADGDGGDELVLVSRTRVALGRIRAGAFTAERTADWSRLAVRAPVPMREPLAGAVVGFGSILVGSTERDSVSLSMELGAPQALVGVPASGLQGAVCLTPEPSAGAFDGAPVDCAMRRDPKPVLAVPAPRFDAFAATRVASPDGATSDLVAVREPSGKVRIKRGDTVIVPDGAFGAQLAIADLDQDGTAELATTADGGPDDAVTIATIDSSALPWLVRFRVAVSEPIRAMAVCPPEQHGEPTLVAVTASELWLIRAGWAGQLPDKER